MTKRSGCRKPKPFWVAGRAAILFITLSSVHPLWATDTPRTELTPFTAAIFAPQPLPNSTPDTLQAHQAPLDSLRIDKVTAQALDAMANQNIKLARALMRSLVDDYPDYHLGQFLLAELHAAHVALPSALNAAQFKPKLMQLLLEASSRQRSQSALSTPITQVNFQPPEVLKLGKGLHHWVQVNLEQGTQTVFKVSENTFLPLWQQYISFGAGGYGKTSEGDLKTPLGVYRINGFRDDASLPELYGSGALMLDYPNAADRFEQRTGSGIWLHGVPRSSRSRGPLASEGCVTMGNDYLTALHQLIQPTKTLVSMSAKSLVNRASVNLDNIKAVVSQWQAEHKASPKTLVQAPEWNSATVVVSGAGSIAGEPQQVTVYFPTTDTQSMGTQVENFGKKKSELGFKALFLKRKAYNSHHWLVIADELASGEK